MPRPTLQITITSETPSAPRRVSPETRRWLITNLRKLAKLAGVTQGELSIRIIEDAAMAEHHERFTGISGTTDVLTFDLRDANEDSDDQAANQAVEGDIMICIDEAQRQSALRTHDINTELLLYCLHALLHLLGYDDHTKADYGAMHKREDELFKLAGFGPVFKRK